MSQKPSINDVIEFAFSRSVWISKETQADVESKFAPELVELLAAVLKDSTWPAEPWTTAKSLTEAATLVEPRLRKKYPQLSDASVSKVLNYACFQWK